MDNYTLHKNLLNSNIFFTVSVEDENKACNILAAGETTRKKILDNLKNDAIIMKPILANSTKFPMDVLIEKEDKRQKGKVYSDDIRVGPSKLNVLGTIGDSAYDTRIFNTLIDEIEHYRSERKNAYEKLMERLTKDSNNSGSGSGHGGGNAGMPGKGNTDKKRFIFEFERPDMTLKELKKINPETFTYNSIKSFIVKQDNWENVLKKHIKLPESYDTSSMICSSLLNFRNNHKLKCSGLKRQPDIRVVANGDIKLFVIASDGVIKFFDIFKNKYYDMIIKNKRNLQEMANKMIDYLSFLGDDRSVVCCSF